MSAAERTTDHQIIRQWAERHGGRPACVKGTGRDADDPGILRLDFGEPEETLEPISWEAWLAAFERNQLALLYSKDSRFNKLIAR